MAGPFKGFWVRLRAGVAGTRSIEVGADVRDERQEEGLEQQLAASASNIISPAADLLA
jgi:hypothetical protein